MSVIYIGHKLHEILELAEDFVVMRDGHLAWAGPRGEITHDRLVGLMSQAAGNGTPAARDDATLIDAGTDGGTDRPAWGAIGGRWCNDGATPVHLRAGEIVGLSGLEGSGQEQLLRAIYEAPLQAARGHVRRRAPAPSR